MSNDTVIHIEHLYKDYVTEAGTVPVLKDVAMSVKPGEFVAIMGPSGSGKSTFMNILGCLDVATSGTYLLNGRDVNAQSRDELALLRNQVMGFVFQGFNLLPRASLEDNVALRLIYRGAGRAERIARAHEMLDKVGLGQYRNSRPNQISGAQQQRVAIARAIVNQPRLVLADEPTGNLDTKTSEEVMALFQELWRAGLTIVFVTHEPDVAAYASRVVTMRDGKIVSDVRQTPRIAGKASAAPKAA